MIDKDGKIITLKEQIEKHYCFIKENTAQIAIIISIFASIYKNISDYYFYIVNYGYYKYFGIEGTLMLPYNKNNFYQNVGTIAILLIYWGYAILSVRTFKLKKHLLKKLLFFVMIPLMLSIIWVYDEITAWSLSVIIIAISFLIVFQWIMIYSLGFCMVLSFEKETVDIPKRKRSKVSRRGDANYMIVGILLMFICFAMFFYCGHQNNYTKATEQRIFGTVIINNERYAVIDANEEKLILQKCEINGSTLYIDKNTYLCVNNEVLISYETYEDVEVK